MFPHSTGDPVWRLRDQLEDLCRPGGALHPPRRRLRQEVGGWAPGPVLSGGLNHAWLQASDADAAAVRNGGLTVGTMNIAVFDRRGGGGCSGGSVTAPGRWGSCSPALAPCCWRRVAENVAPYGVQQQAQDPTSLYTILNLHFLPLYLLPCHCSCAASPSAAACPTASPSSAPAPSSCTASPATWTGSWQVGSFASGGAGPGTQQGLQHRNGDAATVSEHAYTPCCGTCPPRRRRQQRRQPLCHPGAQRQRLHPRHVAPCLQGDGGPCVAPTSST